MPQGEGEREGGRREGEKMKRRGEGGRGEGGRAEGRMRWRNTGRRECRQGRLKYS